jgi:hypothetical protein
MRNKLALLFLPLILIGCQEEKETESECFDRHIANVEKVLATYPTDTVEQAEYRVALSAALLKMNTIYLNEDLNVCDFTILGTSIVKIE